MQKSRYVTKDKKKISVRLHLTKDVASIGTDTLRSLLIAHTSRELDGVEVTLTVYTYDKEHQARVTFLFPKSLTHPESRMPAIESIVSMCLAETKQYCREKMADERYRKYRKNIVKLK